MVPIPGSATGQLPGAGDHVHGGGLTCPGRAHAGLEQVPADREPGRQPDLPLPQHPPRGGLNLRDRRSEVLVAGDDPGRLAGGAHQPVLRLKQSGTSAPGRGARVP